jgi:hypothetical protein
MMMILSTSLERVQVAAVVRWGLFLGLLSGSLQESTTGFLSGNIFLSGQPMCENRADQWLALLLTSHIIQLPTAVQYRLYRYSPQRLKSQEKSLSRSRPSFTASSRSVLRTILYQIRSIQTNLLRPEGSTSTRAKIEPIRLGLKTITQPVYPCDNIRLVTPYSPIDTLWSI